MPRISFGGLRTVRFFGAKPKILIANRNHLFGFSHVVPMELAIMQVHLTLSFLLLFPVLFLPPSSGLLDHCLRPLFITFLNLLFYLTRDEPFKATTRTISLIFVIHGQAFLKWELLLARFSYFLFKTYSSYSPKNAPLEASFTKTSTLVSSNGFIVRIIRTNDQKTPLFDTGARFSLSNLLNSLYMKDFIAYLSLRTPSVLPTTKKVILPALLLVFIYFSPWLRQFRNFLLRDYFPTCNFAGKESLDFFCSQKRWLLRS